jgi:ribosomal protein S18 acetylase RimI-like enzyme
MYKVTLAFTKHYPAILKMDAELNDQPWTDTELKALMCDVKNTFYVVEDGEETRGFIWWRVEPDKFVLNRIVVDSDFWRKGFGTALLKRLKSKCGLAKAARPMLELYVDEENLRAQLFFKSHGFLATEVVGNEYKMIWRKK